MIEIVSMEDVTAPQWSKVVGLVQLLGGGAAVILMVTIYFLLFRKPFQNSYYKLVQFALVVNIFLFINSWFAIRMDLYEVCIPFLKTLTQIIPGFLTATKFLTRWFMHMQFLTSVLFNFYIISVVWWPFSAEKFWTTYSIPIRIGCMLYSFLPCLISGFPSEVYIMNGILTKEKNTDLFDMARTIIAIFSIVYFIIVFVIAFASFVTLRKPLGHLKSSLKKTTRKVAKMAIVNVLVYSTVLIWSVLTGINTWIHFLSPELNDFLEKSVTIVSDINTVKNVILLLSVDSNIRAAIFRTKNVSKSHVISHPTIAVSQLHAF